MSFTATGNLKTSPAAFAGDPELKSRGFSFRRRSSITTSESERGGLDSTSHRSSAALIGAYANMEKEAKSKASRVGDHNKFNIDGIIEDLIKERKGVDQYRKIFEEIDVDGSGELDFDEFVAAYKKINPD
eukprot:scaffold3365_cov211-Skeletonema_menzelii.AAC.1